MVAEPVDGTAVDDVLLETAPGAMPDSIVSACNELEGVHVLWISRYAAGGNVFLDLEAIEDLTAHPEEALDRLVDLVPVVFRSDWAARVTPDGAVRHATDAAPGDVPAAATTATLTEAVRLDVPEDDLNLYAATPVGDGGEVIVLGRRGGPAFLDSELARLGHLAALASSIHTRAGASA